MKRIVGSMVVPGTAVYLSLREADGSRSGTIVFGRDQLSRLLTPFFLTDAGRAGQIMKSAERLGVPESSASSAIVVPSAFVEALDHAVDLPGGSVIQRDIDIPPGGSMVVSPPRPSEPGIVFVHERSGHVVALVPSKETFRALAKARRWDRLPRFAANRGLLLGSCLAESSETSAFLLEGDVAEAVCGIALRAYLLTQPRRKSA